MGPVIISAISPPPTTGRNGSVINVPNVQDKTGFDDRTEGNRFDATLRSNPPFTLRPGDSLVSSISVTTLRQIDNWLREGNNEKSSSPVKSVSILTCVSTPPPADAFRPSYGSTSGRIYRLSEVNRALLPRLQPPGIVDATLLNALSERFSRPWVDNLFFGFDAQVDYMAMYGREVGRATGLAGLFLLLDLPPSLQPAQERLLIGFLQRGIDLWGLVRAGHPGWQAHGGHGSGRKWPIIFAGMLFDDPAMRTPNSSYPAVRFGEDMQTALYASPPYGPAWVGRNAIYTGHTGLWNGVPVSSDPAWGPYEHLPPNQWPGTLGEKYRRCCTSVAWIGQAFAARLMNAESYWGTMPSSRTWTAGWMEAGMPPTPRSFSSRRAGTVVSACSLRGRLGIVLSTKCGNATDEVRRRQTGELWSRVGHGFEDPTGNNVAPGWGEPVSNLVEPGTYKPAWAKVRRTGGNHQFAGQQGQELASQELAGLRSLHEAQQASTWRWT